MTFVANVSKGRLTRLPHSAFALLERYVELLDDWAKVTNLVSKSARDVIWNRHIEDCLELFELAPHARHWLDIGSGAGLPGVVIAIRLLEAPPSDIQLVESDGRKCAFLREVARRLSLPLRVHQQRVETISPSQIGPIDVVTARGFAPLPKTLQHLGPFLENGAIALLPRGRNGAAELDELGTIGYGYQCVVHPTDGGGFLLSFSRRIPATPQ